MSGVASLLADPDRGETAIFRPQGVGPQMALRVLRVEPAEGDDAVLVAAVAALPVLSAGDSFDLGGAVLVVISAEKDAAGKAWRAVCTR